MRKFLVCIICSFLITVSAFAVPSTTYGPTTADDTLWHVASELRPNSDVSVQQVMLAIFCYNENAFSTNNINALEPGKIIKLPSLDKICSLSREQAYFEVEKQDRQWKRSGLKHSRHLIKHKKSAKKSKKTAAISYEQSESPSTETISSEQATRQLTETVTQTTQQSIETVPQATQQLTKTVTQTTQQSIETAPQATQQSAETALQTMSPEQAARVLATNAPQPPVTPDSNETVTPPAQVQETAPVAPASVVTAQMAQLDEKINSIEQNVEQLKKYILENKKNVSNDFSISFKPMLQYIDGLVVRLGQPLFTTLLVCVIVLLLSILFCLSVRRRKRYDATKFLSLNVNPVEEEYNFVVGKEGVAAKLNLARTYIDMGKEAEARAMLDEVLAKGSLSEQEKAKELLAEIKKPLDAG